MGGSSKGLGVRSEDEAGYDDWEYTLGEENLDSMRRGDFLRLRGAHVALRHDGAIER